jgi:hypothetical protein
VGKFIANKEIINKMAARNMDYNSSAGSSEIARVEKACAPGEALIKCLYKMATKRAFSTSYLSA